MLISFSIENWQSFRDRTTLSMVASKERQHKSRIPELQSKMRLLPVAAIYGANGSGKTKFFNALKFVKDFVIRVRQPESSIPREYFKLDNKCIDRPSTFIIVILVNDHCYELSFSVTQHKVVEEKLVKIYKTKEKILYHRKEDKKIEFFDDSELKNDQRLQFVAEGTRENQLFLTNSVDQKIKHFQLVYDWFKHNLILIAPTSTFYKFGQFIQEELPIHSSMKNTLFYLDTGITHLGGEKISINSLFFSEELQAKLIEELPEGGEVINFRDKIILTKQHGQLSAEKLVTIHKSFEGKDIPFDVSEESDGTVRVMDILPFFLALYEHNNPKVYFIDELDNRLHTLLTRSLLETYLLSCTPETRSQLLFTTHDVLLMDQKLMRRDEIWITERDQRGCSSLFSLAEYKKIRFDKDIKKSYLQGRLGGIPKLFLTDLI